MHNIFNDSFIFLAKLTILTWLFYIYHTILFRKRAMRFLPHPLSFLTYLRFRSISIPWYRLGIGFPCFFATSQRCLYKRKRTDFLFFGTSGFSFFGSRLLILPSIILYFCSSAISADRRYSPLIKYFCHTESRSLVAPFCFSCSLIFFKNTGRCLYLPVLKMKHWLFLYERDYRTGLYRVKKCCKACNFVIFKIDHFIEYYKK